MPRTLTPSRAAEVRRTLAAGTPSGGVRRWALDLLAHIARATEPVAAVQHPLGFVCIPAYRAESWGLCLHIWSAAHSDFSASATIHSHSWDMASQVLCGHLDNHIIGIKPAVSDATHRILRITSVGRLDIIEPTDQIVRCDRPDITGIDAGLSYGLAARKYHRSVPQASALTATAVLGENRHQPPELALGALDSTLRTETRPKCTPAVLRDIAQSAVDEIARA